MLPSQALHRLDRATTGAVCPAGAAGARRGERGAVLVHVAVATMGLLAFAALSIDLGAVWVVRAQVQNAVDAASLAGGVSLAYVSPDPEAARAAAETIALQHSVWGQTLAAGAVTSAVSACPAGAPAVSGECMNLTITPPPLPVFFSRIFGALPTTVSATATAKVLLGNAATCPRPLAIPDRWVDSYDETPPSDSVWLDDDLYARYDNTGTLNIFPPDTPDSYAAPGPAGAGSGITVADFRGVEIRRAIYDSTAGAPLRANQLIALDLPRDGVYSENVFRYEDNLASCSGNPMSIGASGPTLWPHRGFYTTRPLDALVASDSGAYWDAGTQSIRGSAFPVSPRLITIAVIDPDAYSSQPRPPGTDPTVVVRNLVGFFLEDAFEASGAVQVRGVLVPMAGAYDASAPTITDQATFLRTVALVR